MSADTAPHWHEGMFLRPQQFQIGDRYRDDVGRLGVAWTRPFAWGLFHVVKGWKAGSSDHVLQVTELDARTKTGTVITLRRPMEFDLTPHFRHEAALNVVVAVPSLALGNPNVLTESGDPHRFVVTDLPNVPDENDPLSRETVRVRRLNVTLALGALASDPRYEVLPLFRFKKPSEGRTGDAALAHLELAPDFIPPLLRIDAWKPLTDRLAELGRLLRARFAQLAAAAKQPDATEFVHLAALREGHAVLSGFAPGTADAGLGALPPHALYLELARLAGRLGMFDRSTQLADLPPYKHDDLGGCFGPLFALLTKQLAAATGGDDDRGEGRIKAK